MTLVLFWSFPVLSTVRAGIIFEDNFDATPDWNTSGQFNGECPYPCATAPNGWNATRSAPGTLLVQNPMPVGSIRRLPGNLPDHTTGTGKAYIAVNQANDVDNWPGDSSLAKYFGQDYPEWYIRVWIRTQSNWQTIPSGTLKVIRAYHYDGTGNIFNYFNTGYSAPIWLWSWGATYSADPSHNNMALYKNSFRCDPQESNYYCDKSSPAAPWYELNDYMLPWNMIIGESLDESLNNPGAYVPATAAYADTNWHRYDFHIKVNTIGSNNGIFEWWYDGVLKISKNDVHWKDAGSSAGIGWNTIHIGGNSDNAYANPGEQWYAIDDVVVSTTPIPADYVPGRGSTDTTPPAPPANLRTR